MSSEYEYTLLSKSSFTIKTNVTNMLSHMFLYKAHSVMIYCKVKLMTTERIAERELARVSWLSFETSSQSSEDVQLIIHSDVFEFFSVNGRMK